MNLQRNTSEMDTHTSARARLKSERKMEEKTRLH